MAGGLSDRKGVLRRTLEAVDDDAWIDVVHLKPGCRWSAQRSGGADVYLRCSFRPHRPVRQHVRCNLGYFSSGSSRPRDCAYRGGGRPQWDALSAADGSVGGPNLLLASILDGGIDAGDRVRAVVSAGGKSQAARDSDA